MKVLQVNNVDLHGRRFNGYDLLEDLRTRDVQGKQAVLSKLSTDSEVIGLLGDAGDQELQHRIESAEHRHSMNGLLFPWGRLLAETQEFQDADVVHYHLIHNQMISLLDLPWLFGLKPTVWTLHDPWLLTGHCVHPMACERWLCGCRDCPSLDAHFRLETDCADRMWRIKQRVLSETDPDIVVASSYMLDMVRRSPITCGVGRVHLIPFGVEPESFPDDAAKPANRARLGIPENDFVVMLRADTIGFKGLQYISEALGQRNPDRPTTLVTVRQRHLLDDLAGAYNIVDLGWLDDPSLLRRVYSACDVFLMPSTAESFGLMALEAMAAGRPVICFEGKALVELTHAPECGIAVPMRDSSALRAAVDHLALHPEEAERRGRLGRTIAAEHYGQERYLDALASLYREVATRSRHGL